MYNIHLKLDLTVHLTRSEALTTLSKASFSVSDKDTTANQGTIALVLSVVCVFLIIAIIWFVRRRNKRGSSAGNHVN